MTPARKNNTGFVSTVEKSVSGDTVVGDFTFTLNEHAPRSVVVDYFYFVDGNGDPVDGVTGDVEVTLSPVAGIYRNMTNGKFNAATVRDANWLRPKTLCNAVEIKFTLSNIVGAVGFRGNVTQNQQPDRSEPVDFFLEVSKGNIAGNTIFTLVSRNGTVGTVQEDVWGAGGLMVYPTAAEQWELVSSSANDTVVGTGAQSVVVFYLDDNYVRQEEVVELNGLTPVPMVADNAFRPRSIVVATAGASAKNEGDVTLRAVGGGDIRNTALIGKNNDQDCHYTVPAGVTSFPIFIYEEINKNEDVVIEYQTTDGTSQIFRTLFLSSIYQNTNGIPFAAPPLPLLEKSDVRIRAMSNNAQASPSIIVQFLEVNN